MCSCYVMMFKERMQIHQVLKCVVRILCYNNTVQD